MGGPRGPTLPHHLCEEAVCQRREQGPAVGQDSYAGDAGRDKDSLACFLGTVGPDFFLAAAFRAKLSADVESSVPGYFSRRPEALNSVVPPHDSGWGLCQGRAGCPGGQDPTASVLCVAQRVMPIW